MAGRGSSAERLGAVFDAVDRWLLGLGLGPEAMTALVAVLRAQADVLDQQIASERAGTCGGCAEAVAASAQSRTGAGGPRKAAGKRVRTRSLCQEPEAVAWAREKSGLTKRALAGMVGISEQLMGEIESGWRSATPANLVRIAQALNCPVVVLERKRLVEATDHR